jgi:energy-coupling factor transporter ATP-binding protein EcfA2
MIHFDHLTYTYPGSPRPVLDGVTLHIAEGELVLLAGPSGVGKSTLLRCLDGLVPHFTGGTLSGHILVAGHDPVAEGPQVLSRVVGFVFQDPEAQFVVDQVEDEVAFALENAAIPRTEMRARVEEVLSLLDLVPLRDRRLDTLSGGEMQRVAIAAALALRPRILVLDEPTSQLDPRSAEEVLQALVRLNRDIGLTVILSEHRLERILPHVDRLVYMPLSSPQGSESTEAVLSGPPRRILPQMDLTPPLVTLGKELGWAPLPLTVEEGQGFAEEEVSGFRFRVSGSDPRPETVKSETVLQVEDLSFSYEGNEALRNVTLDVGQGELVALMGRNGSGKTTLLKCIVGLLRPEQGEIALMRESIAGQETADICKRIGYLPQEPDDLLFADTVADEMEVTLRNHGLVDDPPIAPADLLARLDLSDLARSYPRDLSVGQRQRVALGAVTVTHPRLLLLDEPTRGMDYPAKREMIRLLQDWQAEGMGVLLVTHDVELAAQAADRIVLLDRGQVIADGRPAEVLTASSFFAPQVTQLFPGTGWLTVRDALAGLRAVTPR